MLKLAQLLLKMPGGNELHCSKPLSIRGGGVLLRRRLLLPERGYLEIAAPAPSAAAAAAAGRALQAVGVLPSRKLAAGAGAAAMTEAAVGACSSPALQVRCGFQR
ncbi:hypothetical protein PLESTM_001046300 [Pleodorina starrii]|nr:hypothetical protein PLESTM_001046300 [Pleodorina starrii]